MHDAAAETLPIGAGSYYACFQAAIAALQHVGVRPTGKRKQWGHEFVQAEFVGRLIDQRKQYPTELRSSLQENLRLRQVADYSTDLVTETQARRALHRGDAFIEAVRQRIKDHES
ncbi:MAG TPA: hypothetical protein VGR16_00450 [Thermomicrobiales bacterium]|nr:hypothetical protein [Thermomicrobiales bacterium]